MKRTGAIVLAAALALAAVGCALSRLERALDPESREFLSKVRYLITRQERVAFLQVPADERPSFIEEFWKKRDPNPETVDNEFKIEYFKRIDMANHLFTDGQEPGWLQDRGRMYILLGPPSDRLTYPRGVTFYGLPMEFWYYGFFEIVFVDDNWTGIYRLDPSSAEQIGNIMRAQLEWKPKVEGEIEAPGSLECELAVESRGGGKIAAKILIPYKAIWMKAGTGGGAGSFQTTLTAELEALDGNGKKTWEFKKEYPLSFSKEELDKLFGQTFTVEIEAGPFEAGAYVLNLTLANSLDGGKVHRKAKVTVGGRAFGSPLARGF
jgi:GWxTD domain-containing protein